MLQAEVASLAEGGKIAWPLVGAFAEDDMIEHLNLQQLAGADKVARDFDVSLGRGGVPAYAACGLMLSGVSERVRPRRLISQWDVLPNPCGYTAIELNR